MPQYIYRSAGELAQLIREGQASSVDVIKEHLQRIRQRNGELNAFVRVFEDEALAVAAERDMEARAGKFRGPLHGVPVSIKEQFWIKGKPSTINAKIYKDFVAPEDAAIVSRIRNSGAVILGQTNVSRLLADYQVWGDLYPEGKNPYNTEYTPGGSTGGGAAALAAGFSTLELGGDLGGSVRCPANFCGLYGLKPTEDTIPRHGNIPLPPKRKTYLVHMAQSGPLARTVEDIEILWNIIVGPHESDRKTPRIDWQPSAKSSLSDYRIAWVDGWPEYPVGSEVSQAIHRFIANLQQQGCKLEKASPAGNLHEESLNLWMGLFPYMVAQGASWFVRRILKWDMLTNGFKGLEKHRSEFGRAFRMSANHYGEMMLRRKIAITRWEQFFDHFDLLICPAGFGPAFRRTKAGNKLRCDGTEMIYANYLWAFLACFNASGHPAMNIPLGPGKEGLPLGVQVVGPYWSEPELINFARLSSHLNEGFVSPSAY